METQPGGLGSLDTNIGETGLESCDKTNDNDDDDEDGNVTSYDDEMNAISYLFILFFMAAFFILSGFCSDASKKRSVEETIKKGIIRLLSLSFPFRVHLR